MAGFCIIMFEVNKVNSKNKNNNKRDAATLGKNVFIEIFQQVCNLTPGLGTIFNILVKSYSDIQTEDRFELIEEKIKNLSSTDIEKLEKLPPADSILLEGDLIKLLSAYRMSAYEKRREYLANAIYNEVSLKCNDYQQNEYFITILNNIPDISIELLGLYRKYSKFGKKKKSESISKDFEELKKKYSTQLSQNEVLQNNITNGLIIEKNSRSDFNNLYGTKETEYQVSDVGHSLLDYISNDVK